MTIVFKKNKTLTTQLKLRVNSHTKKTLRMVVKNQKRKNNHKNLIKEAKPVGNELKKKAKEARKLAAKAEKGKGRREKQADDDDEKASSG